MTDQTSNLSATPAPAQAAPPAGDTPSPSPEEPEEERVKPTHPDSYLDDGKTIEVSDDLAAAIFDAATNETGYRNTIGSAHATKVSPGVVRIELPHGENGRHTVVVKVPETLTFQMV